MKRKEGFIICTVILCFFTLHFNIYAQNNWKTFKEKSGKRIVIKENERTNNVEKIHGKLIDLSDYNLKVVDLNYDNVNKVSKRMLDKYQNITNIKSKDLIAHKLFKNGDTWYLSYKQSYNGIEVYGSKISFAIEKTGKVNNIRLKTFTDIDINSKPGIPINKSFEIAKQAFTENNETKVKLRKDISLVIYPHVTDNKIEYYLVYKIELYSDEIFKEYIYFIDANSGKIVDSGNLVRNSKAWWIRGNVKIQYYPEHADDTPVNYDDLSNVQINIYNYTSLPPEASGQTNSNGYYSITWGSPPGLKALVGVRTLDLSNSWCKIMNAHTKHHTYQWTPTGGGIIHNWSWATSETNVFYHVDVIHDYWTSSPFYYNTMNYQMKANMHSLYQGQPINGRSDGTDIYFGHVNNIDWALFSDVIYHEYTHCVIHHIYGDWIDPYPYDENSEAMAMDEGFPDYYACSINDDAISGDGTYAARDIGTDIDHWTENNPHENGRIISGACWDMRESTLGVTYTDKLVYKALLRNSDNFEDYAIDVVSEDLAMQGPGNGNIDIITTCFNNHGIMMSCGDCHSSLGKPISSENDIYENSKPVTFNLLQNYPNPFNPETTIKYDLPEDAYVTITVYRNNGQRIEDLVQGFKPAGSYNVTFNGQDLASGVYFYRIQAGDFVQTKRMLLIK